MLNEFHEDLIGLKNAGLLRELAVYNAETNTYCFASNDYLNLAQDPRVMSAACRAVEEFGAGSKSSRLVAGTLACHEALEGELAKFFGQESSLVFGAGYLANLGLLSSLASRDDIVFLDKYCHASLIDGAILSRAKIHRFRHNDAEHLKELLQKAAIGRKAGQRFVIVTESVFSMDGDLAPLAELNELAKSSNAILVIDEAHALGVFGNNGHGCWEGVPHKTEQVFITATLSKALGSCGGIVACGKEGREFLVNHARSFIYNTALAPACVGAALESLRIIQSEKQLGQSLLRLSASFTQKLRADGVEVLETNSQIVPALVRGNQAVVSAAQRLQRKGIVVPAIRTPTVARGSERLRFSLTLGFDEASLLELATIISAELR